MSKYLKSLIIPGFLAIIGCAGTVNRVEYEAAEAARNETIKLLRDELTAARSDYEKTLADITKLITERTSIEALIPKVGEAKEDILKQLRKDYNELTEKWKAEKDSLEGTRRTTVSDLEQLKRYFEQTAKPAIGKPEDAEGPSTGIYADRNKIENHETRLANQKKAFHKLEQNLAYQRIVEEWSYALLLEYRNALEQGMGNIQQKLDALKIVKTEERAKALEEIEKEITTFEKNVELMYEQQKEKRKKLPPRPEEKND